MKYNSLDMKKSKKLEISIRLNIGIIIYKIPNNRMDIIFWR